MKKKKLKENTPNSPSSEPFFNKKRKKDIFSTPQENKIFFVSSKNSSGKSIAKGDGELEEESKAPSLAEIPVAKPTAIAPGENKEVSGTVPDIKTPSGEISPKGHGEFKDDFPELSGKGNVVADINMNYIQPTSKGSSSINGKKDPISSGVSIGSFSQPGGRAVDAFGEEFFEPAFKNISYAFKGGKCVIKATLDIICPWGTASGGKIDVPSATSAVVTKTDWADIVSDLTPGAAAPHKSPRTKFYSKALVQRHEKFHGTDDWAWSKTSGIGIVKTFLEGGVVLPMVAPVLVPAWLEKTRKKLISENLKWYKGGGASHGSYAGEIRAYADGKAAYQALADGVEAHGKTL